MGNGRNVRAVGACNCGVTMAETPLGRAFPKRPGLVLQAWFGQTRPAIGAPFGGRQAVGHAAQGRRGTHASSLVGGSWSVAPLSRWRKEIMGRQRRRRELACVRYNRGHCAQQRHPVDGKRPQYHRSPLGHSTRGQVRSSGRQRRGKHGLRPCNKHGLWSEKEVWGHKAKGSLKSGEEMLETNREKR